MKSQTIFFTLHSLLSSHPLPAKKEAILDQMERSLNTLERNDRKQAHIVTREELTAFLFLLDQEGIITMNPLNGMILHHQMHRARWSSHLEWRFQEIKLDRWLYEQLKTKRNQLAKRMGIKPYHVCQNTFLEWLSTFQPTTLEEVYKQLPMVNGMVHEGFLLHLLDVIRKRRGMSSLATLVLCLHQLQAYLREKRSFPPAENNGITRKRANCSSVSQFH
jgi:hypothetical protein